MGACQRDDGVVDRLALARMREVGERRADRDRDLEPRDAIVRVGDHRLRAAREREHRCRVGGRGQRGRLARDQPRAQVARGLRQVGERAVDVGDEVARMRAENVARAEAEHGARGELDVAGDACPCGGGRERGGGALGVTEVEQRLTARELERRVGCGDGAELRRGRVERFERGLVRALPARVVRGGDRPRRDDGGGEPCRERVMEAFAREWPCSPVRTRASASSASRPCISHTASPALR